MLCEKRPEVSETRTYFLGLRRREAGLWHSFKLSA